MPLGNYAQQYSAPHVGNTVQDCSPEVLASRRKCKTSVQPGQAVSHRNPVSRLLDPNFRVARRSGTMDQGLRKCEPQAPPSWTTPLQAEKLQ